MKRFVGHSGRDGHPALPAGFAPVQDLDDEPEQISLFSQTLEEVWAEIGIAPEEYRRWRSLGWVPDDGSATPPDKAMGFDHPRRARLALLVDMARSGLPDHVITGFLQDLPLGADPARVALSFRHGWVEAVATDDTDPEEDANHHDDADECFDRWFEEAPEWELELRLEQIVDRLKELGAGEQVLETVQSRLDLP